MRGPMRFMAMLGAVPAVTLTLVAAPARPVLAQPASVTVDFPYTGAAQTWTVPPGVSAATFNVYGAQGGAVPPPTRPGGLGGHTTVTLAVTPGTVYQIVVGGRGGDAAFRVGGAGGFNGGGAGAGTDGRLIYGGAGGGGASDVRSGACAATQSCGLAARIIVAGGGGGMGIMDAATGGAGGGMSGGHGGTEQNGFQGGGGTQSAGGTAGGIPDSPFSAQPGSLGAGGAGAVFPGGQTTAGGAGGGGGYYGGGGGFGLGAGGAGGGGGSGFPAKATFETGVRAGDGLIQVTYQAAANTAPMRIYLDVSLDGRAAPADTFVQALVGDVICGVGRTGADGRLWLEVASAGQSPGCGTTGAPLRFQAGFRSALATPPVAFVSGGQSKSTLVVGAAPASMQVSGTIIGGVPAPKRTVEALVNGQVCGSTGAQNGAFTLIVASATSQPGCALGGDRITFQVDGKAATGSVTFVSGGNAMVTLQLP